MNVKRDWNFCNIVTEVAKRTLYPRAAVREILESVRDIVNNAAESEETLSFGCIELYHRHVKEMEGCNESTSGYFKRKEHTVPATRIRPKYCRDIKKRIKKKEEIQDD